MHQGFGVGRREVQPIVPEFLENAVGELARAREISGVETRLVKIEQRIGQHRVIVQKSSHASRAITPRPVHATVGHAQPGRKKIGGGPRRLQIPIRSGRLVGRTQALDHQRVPARDDVFVAARANAPRPLAEQSRTQSVEPSRVGRVQLDGPVGHRAAALEIPVLGDPKRTARERAILRAERLVDLRRSPNVEAALFALAVGVLAGEKAAFRMRQVAQHVLDRPLEDPAP